MIISSYILFIIFKDQNTPNLETFADFIMN
jgi:hypothetical protein